MIFFDVVMRTSPGRSFLGSQQSRLPCGSQMLKPKKPQQPLRFPNIWSISFEVFVDQQVGETIKTCSKRWFLYEHISLEVSRHIHQLHPAI